MAEKQGVPSPIKELTEAGREFYRRGWTLGTSGNFSILLARKPLRICITASGNEKGDLDETNFLELDDDAEILQGFGKPSAETLLHLSIYRHVARVLVDPAYALGLGLDRFRLLLFRRFDLGSRVRDIEGFNRRRIARAHRDRADRREFAGSHRALTRSRERAS